MCASNRAKCETLFDDFLSQETAMNTVDLVGQLYLLIDELRDEISRLKDLVPDESRDALEE